MNAFFTDAHQTFVPFDDVRHGPLPLPPVGTTPVTGLVDAFSYLVLGHVFVANMTGNFAIMDAAIQLKTITSPNISHTGPDFAALGQRFSLPYAGTGDQATLPRRA